MNKSTSSKPSPGKIATQSSEDSVGYQLSATYRVLNRALQAQVARLDVPAGTWIFLRTIWEEDGLTQREVGRRVGIMEAAAGSALNKLESRGLIRRVRNADDRRKINIYLTERGRALGHELMPKADELTARMVEGFEHFEVAQLCSYLMRVRQNLRAVESSADIKNEGTENTIDS
ncbi:MAG: hypothetical protein ABS43_16065 [Bordetella sp. SCN 67-23]|uniref:MarR family winged helix-turn-helix transcriptional regulator n=1 Tax=Pigmentiphaga sp. H8 TaxID=2488560 RepID=UPI00086AC707|nr:MarR family transcriptional regulator [Pigmentiphaga sp. H8]AZG06977.1 MarR family transcriptional regulator [Pigmentiphaga sp. H8]MBN9477010.1 MarR family transcriptional regulator [Burkholderiales bacterium]ODS72754.1 MAG: hypothetical protein ABS43_16065 [Bordetella sp. SCN 67-23]OJW92908.1 MAG: hypothetical protein BGO71_24505 [Burkholderiales bacterium 67-32]